MSKLSEYNEFLYGPYNIRGKRDGGLYYISQNKLGGHNVKSKLVFGLLEYCIKAGDDLANRDLEEDFLINSGKEICKYLKLNYNLVIQGISELWHDDLSYLLETNNVN